MHITFLVFMFFVNAFALESSNPCHKRLRAVVDLGSGSTKLTMSEIEACPTKVRYLRELPENASVPVALEASKSAQGSIPKEAQDAALTALHTLREKAIEVARTYHYKKFELTVVGTHAFRTAANQKEFEQKLTTAGFPVRALTQSEEARAGFEGVILSALPKGCTKDTLVVWDVGGGSMQLTRSEKQKPNFVGLDFGSESFKQKVMRTIPKATADPTCTSALPSPNPIGPKNLPQLKAISRQDAELGLGKNKAWQTSCVVGIGGVHAKAIEAQIEKNWEAIKSCACGKSKCQHAKNSYTRTELDCLTQAFAVKNDCDPAIKGPYSATSVSNLLLILGFMEQLKISKVNTASVNMGRHFALDQSSVTFAEIDVPN